MTSKVPVADAFIIVIPNEIMNLDVCIYSLWIFSVLCSLLSGVDSGRAFSLESVCVYVCVRAYDGEREIMHTVNRSGYIWLI